MPPLVTSLEHWPLVVTMARGQASFADHEAYLNEWHTWFAQKERFYVLRIFTDDASLEQTEGVAKLTKQWLREGAADAIREKVGAMVNIVPASAYPEMSALSVEKVFGVPGTIAATLEDGIQWLKTNVREAGLVNVTLSGILDEGTSED